MKILFLGANPADSVRLRLDAEIRAIAQALRHAQFRDKFELLQDWAVRVTDIQELLLRHQPDIVHFSSHGSQQSEIILEDDAGNSFPVPAQALSQLFALIKGNLQCVVLNACYSEQQAKSITEHIDYVIGMSAAIDDKAAIRFSSAFYQALGFGQDIATAFELGCNQLALEGLNEQDTPKLLRCPLPGGRESGSNRAEQPASYSVFFCLNSEDADFVEQIAVHLADKARLKPWFDRWEMIPGESAIDQLERGLQTCPTCAVFVGASGKGPWQQKEVETALRKQIENKAFRVIPVLLPGAPDKPELPSFLGNNVWIDLRRGLSDDHALWLLECGILGKPPGRGRPQHAESPPVETAGCKPSEYVQANVVAAANKAQIFISYRHQETDSALARICADALRRAGHDVFLDTGIRWGADWVRAIREALTQADYLLLLLSREAAASEMVQEEILLAKELAQERNGLPIILPVRVCLPFTEPLPYSVAAQLDQIQQESWANDQDTPRLVTHLLEITSQQTTRIAGFLPALSASTDAGDPLRRLRSDLPTPQFDPRQLVIPGGALDLDSRFYISREADEEVFFALQRPRALITICRPRQVGKTSLIMRTCGSVRHSQEPLRVVFVDLQALPDQVFANLDAIWRSIAQHIVDQLLFDEGVFADWKAEAGYNRNFTRFLNRVVFAADETPLLLCLDEVDRVFSAAVRSEFFAAVRAFYNRGAMDRNWKNVRWMLGTSTEPAFFIENLTQSPFNIGYRLELNCFTPTQVDAFARRHGISLTPAMLDRIMRYLGGRPYLVHLLLYHWVRKPADREKLFDAQTAGNGVFKDHLHRYLLHFQQTPDMAECMKAIIAGKSCADLKMAARFESAGLVRRDENNRVAPLCDLYAAFFAQTLR